MSSLEKKIVLCLLSSLILFSACQENVVEEDNWLFSSSFFNTGADPVMDSILYDLVPTDLSSVDCYQQIMYSDEFRECSYLPFTDQYKMTAKTYFRDRPHDANNVQCNGNNLAQTNGGFTKSFCKEWLAGQGPRNQNAIWRFDRDGQTVYDTIGVGMGFGAISFKSMAGAELTYLDLDSNFNLTWQNTDSGSVGLLLHTFYASPKIGKKYALFVPNTGSYNITRSTLINNFGADFDSEQVFIEVVLVKAKYKFKKYGLNNDKTLLTGVISTAGAVIVCE